MKANMWELIIGFGIAGITFLLFIFLFLVGLLRKRKNLILYSIVPFFASMIIVGWTSYHFARKTYGRITDSLKPRTGEQIYDALLGERQTNCIKVIHSQDQVVPKIDFAIFLEFETCPQEIRRIITRPKFTYTRQPSNHMGLTSTTGVPWFNTQTLGDSIIILEYRSEDLRNIQTIWLNRDTTKAFLADALD